ncbi:MAG: FkbM family methyltransferase [Alphaproteobacteria bacterium]|nr:FkbM family methyltransferase [Alphaproteobacteria bacterium]
MKIFSNLFNKPQKLEFRKNFYSQDGEDTLLTAFYEGQPEYKGFYIDIGALHPLRFSNTQIFYERGWHGINIDATPGSMKLFNKVRPNDVNIEAGISDARGQLEYYSFEEPALNSFSKEISEERIKNGWKLKEIVQIETFPINDILCNYVPEGQVIDFITMDIEGVELRVLESLDFSAFGPKFFLIEELEFVERDFTELKSSSIYKFLHSKGYIPVAKTMRTVIYQKQ